MLLIGSVAARHRAAAQTPPAELVQLFVYENDGTISFNAGLTFSKATAGNINVTDYTGAPVSIAETVPPMHHARRTGSTWYWQDAGGFPLAPMETQTINSETFRRRMRLQERSTINGAAVVQDDVYWSGTGFDRRYYTVTSASGNLAGTPPSLTTTPGNTSADGTVTVECSGYYLDIGLMVGDAGYQAQLAGTVFVPSGNGGLMLMDWTPRVLTEGTQRMLIVAQDPANTFGIRFAARNAATQKLAMLAGGNSTFAPSISQQDVAERVAFGWFGSSGAPSYGAIAAVELIDPASTTLLDITGQIIYIGHDWNFAQPYPATLHHVAIFRSPVTQATAVALSQSVDTSLVETPVPPGVAITAPLENAQVTDSTAVVLQFDSGTAEVSLDNANWTTWSGGLTFGQIAGAIDAPHNAAITIYARLGESTDSVGVTRAFERTGLRALIDDATPDIAYPAARVPSQLPTSGKTDVRKGGWVLHIESKSLIGDNATWALNTSIESQNLGYGRLKNIQDTQGTAAWFHDPWPENQRDTETPLGTIGKSWSIDQVVATGASQYTGTYGSGRYVMYAGHILHSSSNQIGNAMSASALTLTIQESVISTSLGANGTTYSTITLNSGAPIRTSQLMWIKDTTGVNFTNYEIMEVSGSNMVRVTGGVQVTLTKRGVWLTGAKAHGATSVIGAFPKGQAGSKYNVLYNYCTNCPTDSAGKRFKDVIIPFMVATMGMNDNGTPSGIVFEAGITDVDLPIPLETWVDADFNGVSDQGFSGTGVAWHLDGYRQMYADLEAAFGRPYTAGAVSSIGDLADGVQWEGCPDDSGQFYNPNAGRTELDQWFAHFQVWRKKCKGRSSHICFKAPTSVYPNTAGGLKTVTNGMQNFRLAWTLGQILGIGFSPENMSDQSNPELFDEYFVDSVTGQSKNPFYGGNTVPVAASTYQWMGLPLGEYARQTTATLTTGNALINEPLDTALGNWTSLNCSISFDPVKGALLASAAQTYSRTLAATRISSPSFNFTTNNNYVLFFEVFNGLSLSRFCKAECFSMGAGAVAGHLFVAPPGEWWPVCVTFRAKATASARVNFYIGRQNGQIWFRNVRLWNADGAHFMREYEHACVLCNASAASFAFTLPPGKWRRISGYQETSVNSGALITATSGGRYTVTLPAYDGLVLTRATDLSWSDVLALWTNATNSTDRLAAIETRRQWFVDNTGPRIALNQNPLTGTQTITTQVQADALTGRIINGNVNITTGGLTVQNCKIVATSGTSPLTITGNIAGTVIRYVEVDGAGFDVVGVGGSGFADSVTVEYCNFRRCTDLMRSFDTGSIFRWCYLYEPNYFNEVTAGRAYNTATDPHCDGVQVTRGAGLRMLDSFIDMRDFSFYQAIPTEPGHNACFYIKPDSAAISDIRIERTYMNGCPRTVSVVDHPTNGAPTGIVLQDVIIGRGFQNFGVDTNAATAAGVTLLNVLYEDTATAVPKN